MASPPEGPPLRCPACDEPAPPGANWCEACGADLDTEPAAACVACGALEVADDGYCMSCGHKQPTARDRVEVVSGPVVAISDRGLRHHHNEDAVAVAALDDGGAVLVVCDGVSSTPGSAEASLAAAEGARDLLAIRSSGPDACPPGVSSDPVLTEATAAAQATVAALGEGAAPGLAPSSTFVATVARPVDDVLHLDVAWLGDSRAYWIGDDEAVQLTQDHEIEGSLTRWLGADAAEVAPGVAHYLVDAPGVVMVCSDGLWRYGDPPSALHQLVTDLRADHPTDGDLAAALVTHALDGGGHDNISIALWPWPGPGLGAAGPSPNQSKETR